MFTWTKYGQAGMILPKSVTGTAPSSLPLGGVFSKQIYFGKLYDKSGQDT